MNQRLILLMESYHRTFRSLIVRGVITDIPFGLHSRRVLQRLCYRTIGNASSCPLIQIRFLEETRGPYVIRGPRFYDYGRE